MWRSTEHSKILRHVVDLFYPRGSVLLTYDDTITDRIVHVSVATASLVGSSLCFAWHILILTFSSTGAAKDSNDPIISKMILKLFPARSRDVKLGWRSPPQGKQPPIWQEDLPRP